MFAFIPLLTDNSVIALAVALVILLLCVLFNWLYRRYGKAFIEAVQCFLFGCIFAFLSMIFCIIFS